MGFFGWLILCVVVLILAWLLLGAANVTDPTRTTVMLILCACCLIAFLSGWAPWGGPVVVRP